jgi:hypothetical protein
MHQCGGLQGLPGLFLGHPLGSQLTQFVIDQRQELLGGGRVALLDGGQDARDVAHGSAFVKQAGHGYCNTAEGRVPLEATRDRAGSHPAHPESRSLLHPGRHLTLTLQQPALIRAGSHFAGSEQPKERLQQFKQGQGCERGDPQKHDNPPAS